MKVELIGTGSIGAKELSACALINDEIMIDMPNGVVKRLKQTGHDVMKIKNILITHLHGDHFFDIPFFMLERYFYKPTEMMKIYCPIGGRDKIFQLFNLGFPGDYEKIKDYINIEFIEFDELKNEKLSNEIFVDSKLVDHAELKPAHGFIIKSENKKIGFSGDSRFCNTIEEIVEESDVSVLDMSSAEHVSPAHLGMPDIEKICDKYKNKTIVATHIQDYTRVMAKSKNIENLIVPDDGYCITL